MKEVNVDINATAASEYPIYIGENLLEQANELIKKNCKATKYLIITNEKIDGLWGDKLHLENAEKFIIPDGEKYKNFDTLISILNKASELRLDRKCAFVAFGGGVIGDMTGFAASIYRRGVDFVQIPTTLLAQVDSSVGGKTAIDLAEAKNIIGTFYQPKKVYININFLNTLDKRQFMSGLGEVLKYAFIEESCKYENPLYLFEFLTLGCEKIMEKEPLTIIRMIEYCLHLKIAVVNQDEKEGGLRKILNFGHTLAHALETITKYKKYTHGEAVVLGMFFIIEWAYKKQYISYSYYRLSNELFAKYGFKPLDKKYPTEKLVEIMKKDKKATSDKIAFIIPSEKKQVKEIKLAPPEVEDMFL